MSTVATFFSGVTATTMQYAMNQERMGAAVMGLWISSLILSIASAINSQLAMHWRAAMYRSPRSALPIWTSVCLDHTPLLCLIGAVLAFSTGLVVWTFAADLALAVKICAAGMTCATSVILFTVIIWEGGEWWQESRKRQMGSEQIAGMPALHYPWQPWSSTKRAAGDARSRLSDLLANAGTFLGQKRQKFVKLIRERFRGDPQPPTLSLPSGNPNRRRGVDFSLSLQSLKGAGFAEQVSASRRSSLLNPGEGVEVEVQNPEAVALPVPGTATSDYFALNRRGDTNLPVNRRISPTLERFYRAGKHLIENDALRASLQTNRPENSRPRRDELRSLCPVQMLPIYHPAGRDIHFSPDGTRLSVGVLDGYMAIWDVGKYDEEAQTIISPVGRFAWSPDSSYIVIIMDNGLLIWNKDSGWKDGQIRRPIGVIAWLQEPSTFLAMVDYVPHILDTEGKVRKRLYRLPLHVHDVASMPSQQTANYGFILVLGALIDDTSEWASGSRFTRTLAKRPKDAIPERRLMVIDADTDASFAEASILADARHVCVSREGSFALVSYANGDCPELWQLQDRFGNIQLELCRGYAPRSVSSPDREADKISGKACCCGESDEWVMATNGRSEIYIWDRAMGHLLHTLQATQIASKWPEYGSISTITSKTINDSKTNLTVVSTCTNGGVVIWECPDLAIPEVQSNASEAESPGAGTIDLNDP